MKHSESIAKISAAFIAVQRELKNVARTAENPYFKSEYAPLDEVLDAVKPSLNKHGISLIFDISHEGTDCIVAPMLMHESGEWLQLEGLLLPLEKKTAQSAGGAVTYGMRYTAQAILGISSEEDDDGNVVNHPKEPSVETMKFKTKDLTEYSTNYFRSLKYTLPDVYKFCEPFKFDAKKIEEHIRSL